MRGTRHETAQSTSGILLGMKTKSGLRRTRQATAATLILTCALLVGTASWHVMAQQTGSAAVFVEGATYWMATARYTGRLAEYVGDANTLGLQLGIEAANGRWIRCSFVTGNRDFLGDCVDYFLSNATVAIGFGNGMVDLGAGLGWESLELAQGNLSSWGPVGIARFSYPISEHGLFARATATVRPIGLGSSDPFIEYAELAISVEYTGRWTWIELGYRRRAYYNLTSQLSYSGPFLGFQLALPRLPE